MNQQSYWDLCNTKRINAAANRVGMSTEDFKIWCDDLEQIASEVLNDQEPACNFSDDQDVVEFEQDFMSVFEDR